MNWNNEPRRSAASVGRMSPRRAFAAGGGGQGQQGLAAAAAAATVRSAAAARSVVSPPRPSAAAAAAAGSSSMRSQQDKDRKKPAAASAAVVEDANYKEACTRRMHLDSLRSPSNNAKTFWPTLPEKYQADKEFVLTALQHCQRLPDKSQFERKFPQALRFDKDVILAFCARADFLELYEQRHLYPPFCLTNDKDVMLAYCAKIPRSLQECSEELADDRDVVEAAIALDGLELQYASRRLQQDEAVVKAACLRDGRALEFCPIGPLKTQLCQDREFMLQVMRHNGGSMWKLMAEPLKDDRELLLEALANGLRLRFCPPSYQEDVEFLSQALERKSELYLELTREKQAHQALAIAAISSPSSTAQVHERALDLIPGLQANRTAVLAIASRGSPDVVRKLFLQCEEHFRDDKEIVMAALSKSVGLYSSVSPRLRADHDVMVAAMDESSALDIIKLVSPTVQEEYPEIPAHAIRVASKRSLRYLRPHILPATLWGNKAVATAWLQRGQRYMEAFAPFMGDADVALILAQHNPFEFSRVSQDLRSDPAFMRQALTLNGRVLRHATRELQSDYGLIVRAVATSSDALWSGAPVTKLQLIEYLDNKLQLHKVFVGEFLRGIAISNPRRLAPSCRSALPLLDRGVETCQAFKRLIAEFLGVPIGQDLANVRLAHNNLTNPNVTPPPADPHPDDDDDGIFGRRRLGMGRHRALFRGLFPADDDFLDHEIEDEFDRIIDLGFDEDPLPPPVPPVAAAAAPRNVAPPAAAAAAAGARDNNRLMMAREREAARLHPFGIRIHLRRRREMLDQRREGMGMVRMQVGAAAAPNGNPHRPAGAAAGFAAAAAAAAPPRAAPFARAGGAAAELAAAAAAVPRPAEDDGLMMGRMAMVEDFEDLEEEMFFAAVMRAEDDLEDGDDDALFFQDALL